MNVTIEQLRDRLIAVRDDPTASGASQVNAFEAYANRCAHEGRPLDALRRFTADEVERFWSYVIPGPDGHSYWDGSESFTRNDGHTQRPKRWVWEQRYGPFPATTDVWAECGERNCVTPEHLQAGRSVSRYAFKDEAIIGAAQVAGMRLGEPPRSTWWRKNAHPMPSVIIRRFGSWERFLLAAGFDKKVVAQQMRERGREQKFTDQQLIAGLHALKRKIGRVPTTQDWWRHRDWAGERNLPRSPNTFRERIGGGTWRGGGSWAEVLKQAGLR